MSVKTTPIALWGVLRQKFYNEHWVDLWHLRPVEWINNGMYLLGYLLPKEHSLGDKGSGEWGGT